MTDADTKPPPRQAAIWFIFVTLVLDAMAGGISYPVLPALVQSLGHTDAARAAEIFGIFGTLFFVMQFFASPIQGALSDSFGRRPVILISTVGMVLDYVVMALAPDLNWLYAGRLISGITAGSISAAFAYLIDVTPASDRTRIFGLAGAAMSVGTAVGPALGGLAGTYDLRLPFWIAAGFGVLSALYGWLVLPESLKPETRAAFTWQRANPLTSMVGVVRDHPALIYWAVVIVLLNLAVMGVNSIYAVYVSYRYAWSPKDIGLYLTVFGVWSMGAQSLVVPFVIKRLNDRQTMIAGTILMGLTIMAAGLSPFGYGYAAFAFFWVAGLVVGGAATNTLITEAVGPSDQGRVQGAARSLNSVVGLVAPGLFALILAECIRTGGRPLSGVPYALAGLLTLAGLVVSMRVTRPKSSA
ncbi:MAG TPA: MFS transporter [Rhizomicrobium sp.]|jgi:DHA1 family tetracycline resistance protein-like MFS transporter|nr:MFS transporter [Rhizomicrobium sp.]